MCHTHNTSEEQRATKDNEYNDRGRKEALAIFQGCCLSFTNRPTQLIPLRAFKYKRWRLLKIINFSLAGWFVKLTQSFLLCFNNCSPRELAVEFFCVCVGSESGESLVSVFFLFY